MGRTVPVLAVVAAMLLAVGVAGIATLEPAQAAFPGKNGAIAFSSYEGSAGNGDQVWRVNPNGSGKTMLTDFPTDNYNRNPVWSADGQKIAFDSCEPFERVYCTNDVWVMDANGSDPVKVAPVGQLDTSSEPSWFPSGNNKIAYAADPPNLWVSGTADIFALEFDASGNTVSLTNLTNTPDVGEYSPVVSSDGTRIAFTSYRDGATEIYVMGATGLSAGQPPVRLTKNAVIDKDPVWSPNGRTIAFVREVPRVVNGPNHEIFAMDTDGTDKRRLTKNPADDLKPAYSPNGRRIAFSRGYSSIWKMGADGSNPTPIPGAEGWNPDWQPIP